MLPNHSPLVIAEQFGTLEALYPGRIDLGLGRAPGTDQRPPGRCGATTSAAVPAGGAGMLQYFGPAAPGQAMRAVPGAGTEVPLWILGSSIFGARLAAALGLPYAFASHFAPDAMEDALEIYRREFQPSAQLAEPYAMAGLNVFAADTDEEARRLFTTPQQGFVRRSVVSPGRYRHRSTTSRRTGRRRKSRWSPSRWPATWSATPPTCGRASPPSSSGIAWTY